MVLDGLWYWMVYGGAHEENFGVSLYFPHVSPAPSVWGLSLLEKK